MQKSRIVLSLCVLIGTMGGSSVLAQQITGTPGSPEATTTITGKQLPPPDTKFGGVIEEKASESKPWWPPRVVPPKGAPNVLLIMTDDQGFGAPSTFGGVIPTPAMDRIAKAGLPDRIYDRDSLDHLIVLGEAQLRQILKSYADYYNNDRTHRSLGKDAPCFRQVHRVGNLASQAILGGLHHQYVRI